MFLYIFRKAFLIKIRAIFKNGMKFSMWYIIRDYKGRREYIMNYYSLSGTWQVQLNNETNYRMMLPGTLDENHIGYEDKGSKSWHPDEVLGNADNSFDSQTNISSRFTRKYTYEGEAQITRWISYNPPIEKRIFIEVERARCLMLFINDKKVPYFTEQTISTPHIFEVTKLLNGNNKITFISDNSYPQLPHDEIVYSSAATDETQTNWNGILGYIRLREESSVFISAIRVYPIHGTLKVEIEVSAEVPYIGEITIESDGLLKSKTKKVSLLAGLSRVVFENVSLADDVLYWDEYEGKLYELTAIMTEGEKKKVTFGVRDFGDNGKGKLAINNRTIFLRSETNCAEFPETGYSPMEVEDWITILNVYKSYGVNCVRFHSHCPPDAAFTAADQIGMLMQPELSHWNPKTAFVSDESFEYYKAELKEVILMLANHPSFVMLTLGNELATNDLGHERMKELLRLAHLLDSTRMYANGSNVHYGEIGCDKESDFYTSVTYFKDDLRGTSAAMDKENPVIEGFINNQYPNGKTNYDNSMKNLRKEYEKPVFSFEVGQFEILPDFGELEKFKGISDPANIRLIEDKVKSLGVPFDIWKQYVEATGELACIAYREEIEAVMRTKDMSGISLLGLQDFPGQGTALVGMLNSHLQQKPYPFAKPERFHKFYSDQHIMVLLPKYTFENGELFVADVVVANYGKNDLHGPTEYELRGNNYNMTGSLNEKHCPMGELTTVGKIEIVIDTLEKSSRLDLILSLDGVSNIYPIWVYPKIIPYCPTSVYETQLFDEKTKCVLEMGGIVYLSPASTKENLPKSIQAQFTTDFWSVGTFTAQEGGMGQFINASHPIFLDFPTETHSNWQWWPMSVQRAIILPQRFESIITEMDSYAYMRPMTKLLECCCGNGKLVLSSMGLQELQNYPEARALLSSIYSYMDSKKFNPKQHIACEVIESLVRGSENKADIKADIKADNIDRKED